MKASDSGERPAPQRSHCVFISRATVQRYGSAAASATPPCTDLRNRLRSTESTSARGARQGESTLAQASFPRPCDCHIIVGHANSTLVGAVLRVTAIAVAPLVFGGGVVSATTPASARQAVAPGTVTHYYRAFIAGSVAPGIRIRTSARGYCWTTSGVEGRAYAWRCFRGNYIHDPCFSASPSSRFVVCPDEPWSSRVLVLRLTRPLPGWKLYGFRRDFPWGIWTGSDKRCVSYAASATGDIDGKPVTYGCQGGGFLLGYAHRNGPTWTIYYAPTAHSRRPTSVAISDAWW